MTIGLALVPVAACSIAPGDDAAESERGEPVGVAESAILTGLTSDGDPPVFCPAGTAAAGFRCSGWYCDDIRLDCKTVPGGINFDVETSIPTPWISDNQNGSIAECGPSDLVVGIECRGDWCDEIRVWCGQPNWAIDGCSLTLSLSEESGGTYNASAGHFIQDIRCEGSYCDNKRFDVCELTAGSCVGSCGGSVATGEGRRCYCDTQCQSFGDCCADYAAVCE